MESFPHSSASRLSAGARRRYLGLACALVLPSAQGAGGEFAYQWTGNGFTDNWSNALNWMLSQVPPSVPGFANVLFTPPATQTRVDLNFDWEVGTIRFDKDGFGISQGFRLISTTGRALTVGTIENRSNSDQRVEVALNIPRGTQIVLEGKGDLVLSGDRLGSDSSTLSVSGQAGSGALVLSGNGAQGPDFYDISRATVRLGDVDAIRDDALVFLFVDSVLDLDGTGESIGLLEGNGTVVLGGGHLRFGLHDPELDLLGRGDFSGAFVGDGEAEKVGTATQTLLGSNAGFFGRFRVSEGVLRTGRGAYRLSRFASMIIGPHGRLEIAYDDAIGSLEGDGALALEGDLEIGFGNRSTKFGGVISGEGDLQKIGNGTLTLNGESTFLGAVDVGAGELVLEEGANLGTANVVRVDRNARLRIRFDDEAIGNLAGSGEVALEDRKLVFGLDDADSAFDGRVTGRGTFVKDGAGRFDFAGQSTLRGLVQVRAGTLALGAGDVFTSQQAVDVLAGARLIVGGDGEQFGSLGGAGEVELATTLAVGADHSSSVFAGRLSGPGDLRKQGTGTFTLTGVGSAITGRTFVDGGVLRIAGGGGLRNAGASIGAINGVAGEVVVEGANSHWSDTATLRVGDAGDGRLEVRDGGRVSALDMALGAFGGRRGAVEVEGGGAYLQVAGRLDVGIQGQGLLHIGAAGSVLARTLQIGAGGEVALAGGSLSVNSLAPGAGEFHFEAGTLSVVDFHGDLLNGGGRLAPGSSPGVTRIHGDYVQGAGATLAIELAGTGNFDQVFIDGAASLGGTLEISLIDGYRPAPGAAFDILTAGAGITGAFDTVLLPSLLNRTFVLERSPANVLRLRVTTSAATPAPVPLPASLPMLTLALGLFLARRRGG